MLDIALVWDPDLQCADLAIVDGDLAVDQGLQTAVILSLFTDRLAAPDDALPTSDPNRRGWWGDDPADPMGSRLWLLKRAKAIEETRQRAMEYCRESLAWMIEDGVAQKVTVSAQWLGIDRLGLGIAIVRHVAGGAPVDHSFDFAWSLVA